MIHPSLNNLADWNIKTKKGQVWTTSDTIKAHIRRPTVFMWRWNSSQVCSGDLLHTNEMLSISPARSRGLYICVCVCVASIVILGYFTFLANCKKATSSSSPLFHHNLWCGCKFMVIGAKTQNPTYTNRNWKSMDCIPRNTTSPNDPWSRMSTKKLLPSAHQPLSHFCSDYHSSIVIIVVLLFHTVYMFVFFPNA